MAEEVVVKKQKFSVAITTEKYQTLMLNTIGDPERVKRFKSGITSAVAVNPDLQECDAGTILAGALLGESLNLSPSPQLGHYYLIPFDCKLKGEDGKILYQKDENGQNIKDENGRWIPFKEKRAQFCMGYKGYIQLALRSGRYRALNIVVVKETEFGSWNPFTERLECCWDESGDRDGLSTVGYAARLVTVDGFEKTIYWSKEQMLKYADTYAPAFSADDMKRIANGEIPDKDMWKYSSFWYKNFDAMAQKTMIRQLIPKWGPMSTEFHTAYDRDNKVITIDSNGSFIADNFAPAPITNAQIVPEAASVAQKVNLDDI